MASDHTFATLAGGCFWGVEELFRSYVGVIETTVGYCGGTLDRPTYNDVKKGTTGHAEAIRISFDPKKTCYADLLDFFFTLHDPTTPNRQGNDVGTQYRSAIFFHSEEQKSDALKAIERARQSGLWKGTIATEVVAAGEFYPAEDYHQKYLVKNPNGYTCHYVRKLKTGGFHVETL